MPDDYGKLGDIKLNENGFKEKHLSQSSDIGVYEYVIRTKRPKQMNTSQTEEISMEVKSSLGDGASGASVSEHLKPYSKDKIASISSNEKHKPYMVVKCIIDWLLSFIALPFLLLPFVVISFISFVADPGTVLFCQTRCGRNGKPFKIIKFRTMKKGVIHQHVSAQALSDEDYKRTSNAWQRFLRKTSIDELPQVFNIFLCQMAFIGPRPLVYNEKQVLDGRIENGSIHCRPGMSGLAQINGRRAVDYASKAKYDGEYYQKMNMGFDIKLWLLTVKTVFTHEGAE